MIGLEGIIKEFSVIDVLQLICQQEKSGILTVAHKGKSAEIAICEGKIVSAGFTKHNVGEYLIRAKLLSLEDLHRAQAIQQETYEPLEEILIKQGFIEASDVERALNNQIYETLYDIFQWKEGTYTFSLRQSVKSSSCLRPLPFQSLVLDVLRMIDEWPEVNSSIPSFDLRFQKAGTADLEHFEPAAVRVYTLIDGRRTVQEIIDESLLGKYTTCKILSEFLQHGYIHKSANADSTPQTSRIRIPYTKVLIASNYALLGVILLALVIILARNPQNIFPLFNQALFKQSFLAEYQHNRQIEKIENALEEYKLLYGFYPHSLQDLIASKIINPADFPAQHNQRIGYLAENDSYRLMPEYQ